MGGWKERGGKQLNFWGSAVMGVVKCFAPSLFRQTELGVNRLIAPTFLFASSSHYHAEHVATGKDYHMETWRRLSYGNTRNFNLQPTKKYL